MRMENGSTSFIPMLSYICGLQINTCRSNRNVHAAGQGGHTVSYIVGTALAGVAFQVGTSKPTNRMFLRYLMAS